MEQTKYIIKLDTHGTHPYYAHHEILTHAKEIISYATIEEAKKFDSKKEAREFIRNQLPSWTDTQNFSLEKVTKQTDEEGVHYTMDMSI